MTADMHTAAQRASRWLLMTHDRINRQPFQLTQEFLAQMLGLRRATVSAIARDLAAHGLIHYSRGQISILDRAGLETTTCECYEAIQQQPQQLLDG